MTYWNTHQITINTPVYGAISFMISTISAPMQYQQFQMLQVLLISAGKYNHSLLLSFGGLYFTHFGLLHTHFGCDSVPSLRIGFRHLLHLLIIFKAIILHPLQFPHNPCRIAHATPLTQPLCFPLSRYPRQYLLLCIATLE